jgi:hypothetical protein
MVWLKSVNRIIQEWKEAETMIEKPIETITPGPRKKRAPRGQKFFTPPKAKAATNRLKHIYKAVAKLEKEYRACNKNADSGNDYFLSGMADVRFRLTGYVMEGVRASEYGEQPYRRGREK